MAMIVADVVAWMATLNPDDLVAIDEGGMQLVACTYPIQENGDQPYLEIGGEPIDDDEYEYEEFCTICGHVEMSDGYGGNDCPECWVARHEPVPMQVRPHVSSKQGTSP